MKLLFKQKFFSWLDSYNIYDDNENIVYKVKGEISLGHQLRIYDKDNKELGLVKEKNLKMHPEFALYKEDKEIGVISQEFTVAKPKYTLSFNNWTVEGDIFEWNYKVVDVENNIIMKAQKVYGMTDTYEIDVKEKKNALYAVMIMLAIDAEKDTNNSFTS